MRQALKICGAAALLLTLAGCAAGTPESQHAASSGVLSELVLGFWHGLIAPVSLIVELINRFLPHVLPWTMRLYETKTSGVFYDVGFYLGLARSPVVVWRRWPRRRV